MKICVLGAGVIGVSTAYALAHLGHEVVVIDKNSDVAMGTSHANGAQLSYSHVDPFAGPAALRQLPAYLSGRDPAIRFGVSLSPNYLRWGLTFLRNCTANRATQNLSERAALSNLSARIFAEISEDIPGDQLRPSGHGKLVLLPTEAEFERAELSAPRYRALGLEREILTRNEALEIEPALRSLSAPFAGAIYAASDFALDPVLYCRALKDAAEKRGAVFLKSHLIQKIHVEDGTLSSVQTDQSVYLCNAAVVCLGPNASPLLKPLGLSVPIYPMQGYSVTLPAGHAAPKVSLTSPADKIVFANLGDRLRIAGFMDANLSPKRAAQRALLMTKTAERLWPDITNYESPEISHWTGFRPMTPSGVPIITESRVKRLYLNVGHGSLGYTFAAGSAKRIAGMIGKA